MRVDINTLLDKIMVELQTLHPKNCRQFDDPRLDTYFTYQLIPPII